MTKLPSLLPLIQLLTTALVLPSANSSECTSGGGECLNKENKCLSASAFQSRVASFDDDESILQLLKGTVDSVVSQKEMNALLESLPMSEFVEAKGYDDDEENKDGRAYNAPVAYAGLGLRELSTSQKSRYDNLLTIREKVRSATEEALGICPGTLLVDFTTISQKTEGGAHRAHADNCLHYFDPKTKMARCDSSRTHPYPKRVAASILYLNDPSSGNFMEGEFYFANRSNDGEVDETVPVESGKMIYFTSGVENLHGALPVQRRTTDSTADDDDDDAEPRRLALAMWYVTDPELEEYEPIFRESDSNSKTAQRKRSKSKREYDPNDPTAPKELFTIPIPNSIDVDAMYQSMGEYLVLKTTQQQSPPAWKVNKYTEDTLHVVFKDQSAMFSLEFGVALDDEGRWYAESGVVVERHTDGRKPASLQYMLQESVLLHGVLDALSNLILKKSIDDNNEKERYYLEGELEKARDTLPARGA
mmetsp:Transcript_16284/g.34404  ORF Transcript_16284/g.34404 Transcript_16284/m.34404 type:complete len:477 (+) Transcript_16284:92-1522(+)